MMRTLYLVVTVIVCASIILFVAAFFYIDTHRRVNFCYDVYQGEDLISSVKIDRYNTEEQIVYKSSTSAPFHSALDYSKAKLSVDKRGFRVHSYEKDKITGRVHLTTYINAIDSSISFLTVGHSDFAYAERLSAEKDFAIFESDAVISYFNLVDKYDFKKELVQPVTVLTHTYSFLPPHKSTLLVTCEGEEMITLNGRKMRSLALTARLTGKDKKEILIWVNWWTHVPLLIKIPQDKLLAVLTDKPKEISVKKYAIDSAGVYENRDVTFKNKDITLSGTFSAPAKEGPVPAVLLIWGPGPQDRDGLGMFVEMADELARNGIAVMRFDKRGVGKSGGGFSNFTQEDMISDLESAVEFMAQQKEVDKGKIIALGHSEGGLYAAALAAKDTSISGCIILAGIDVSNLPDTSLELLWSLDKSALNWGEDYLKDIAKTARDTSRVVEKSGTDWTILLNKKVYVKKKGLNAESSGQLEIIRKIKTPLLIIGAKKDTVVPPGHVASLEGALKESGNQNYDVVFLSKSNHFFGTLIQDGIHRTHLELDDKVMPTILEWINLKIVPPPAPEPQPTPVQPAPEQPSLTTEQPAATGTGPQEGG